MSTEESPHKIKCPHCGWIQVVSVDVLVADESTVTVVRGLGDALRSVMEKIRAVADDQDVDEASAWIDMPACPHCGNVYRYNVQTKAVER